MIKPFLRSYVTVLTPLGKIRGKLLKVAVSRHNGYGNLVIKRRKRLVIVKSWIAILIAKGEMGNRRKYWRRQSNASG